jgi:phosphoglucomutase
MKKETALSILEILHQSGDIDDVTYANAQRWLRDTEYKSYRKDVTAMLRPQELIDSFYTAVPFGTGGRRGTVGAGTNRINERTIGESAQGLAQYILAADPFGAYAKKGVAIAYDVRPHSKNFAKMCAGVLAANGVRVFLFEGPRSTPELSFAVRHLECVSGIVITASHNPPTDNGFKAYWMDGGQVVAPHDTGIMEQVMAVNVIKKISVSKGEKDGLIKIIGSEVDDAYMALFPKELWLCDERLAKIVYSPLHGTGLTFVPRALAEMGFTDVVMPADQMKMDGTFPTVPNNYPNPEMPIAMEKAVALAKKVGADIVLASDPDGDRMGVFAPDGKGDYRNLSGNQVGAAMCHFTLSMLKERKEMPKGPFVLTTLVSTQMTRAICKSFRVRIVDDLLVGFKNMAFEMAKAEEKGKIDGFVFAFEESIGFLRGSFVRDKDAASAAVTCAQMVAHLKDDGKTVLDYLDELYTRYGYFAEDQLSVFLYGADGMHKMARIMEALRAKPPREIAGMKVLKVIDRQSGKQADPATGKDATIKGVKGDVMQFWFDEEGKNRLTVRPSGTEPKIKHYAQVYEPVPSPENLAAAKKKGQKKIALLIKSIKAWEDNVIG